MPLSVNSDPTPAGRALAVLTEVQGTFHPGTRLFAAHRRDIAAALAAAGIAEDSDAHARVTETLRTAEAYEADGMYAFVPTWDLLLARVRRLDEA